MLDAVTIISQERPEVQFVLVVAPSRQPEEARAIIAGHNNADLQRRIKIVHHETREALSASDVAAVASGTATLEAALLGTPMVIVYKESKINWNTLGRLITVEHYGLVNLVAGRRIVTELMQDDLNGDRLADELLLLLEPKRNNSLREQLRTIASLLGEPGASQRAAKSILRFLYS